MILKTKCPCKDCTKRVLACHDTCPDYIEFKAEHVRKREAESMQKYDNRAYIGRVIQRSQMYGNKKKR